MSALHSIRPVKSIMGPTGDSSSRKPGRDEPKPWTRPPSSAEKQSTASASPDRLPQWATAAARQAAGAVQPYLPTAPYELGVYIGTHIRQYLENGNLRADIAQLLQNPAVLAAAASVAPRIMGALMLNQAAFGAAEPLEMQPNR
jgi:hypothetical protein